jgi:hypothetical protein
MKLLPADCPFVLCAEWCSWHVLNPGDAIAPPQMVFESVDDVRQALGCVVVLRYLVERRHRAEAARHALRYLRRLFAPGSRAEEVVVNG